MPKKPRPTKILTGTEMAFTVRETANSCALALIKPKTVALPIVEVADTCALVGTAGGAAPSASFDQRKTAAGVVRYFDFDTTASLGTGSVSSNFGALAGDSTSPVIDTSIKCSGTGSLRFDVPSLSGANAAGLWYGNYSSDLSVRFGANTEHFVQFRVRFNQAFIDTVFMATAASGGGQQGGIKINIAGPGDTPTKLWASCEAIHCVIQTYYQSRFPIAYNSCTGSGSHPAYSGFYESIGGDYGLENAMPSPYCRRSSAITTTTPAAPAGCFALVANEWLTFQYAITLGARNNVTNDFDNSRYRLWGMRDPGVVPGAASQLLIDWKPGVGGYFPLAAGDLADDQQFGKVFLLPYMTYKDPTQVHALCQVWYDELIVSTNQIADPTPASAFPVWRNGMPQNQFSAIAGTTSLSGYLWPDPFPFDHRTDRVIDGFGGLARAGSVWYSVATGGHDAWQNCCLKINLGADVPVWTEVSTCSTYATDVSLTGPSSGPYYGNKKPVSAQTYWLVQHVSAAKARDGIERVMRFGDVFCWAVQQGGYGGGPKVNGFKLTTNTWDSQGEGTPGQFWADLPATFTTPSLQSPPASVSQHPTTEVVYLSALGEIYYWTPATGVCTQILSMTPARGTSIYSGGLCQWESYPSLCDQTRGTAGTLVAAISGANSPTGNPLLQTFNLATGVITNINLTGTFPSDVQGDGFVFDPDNNRYLLFAGGANNGNVYTINPTTGVTSLLTTITPSVTSIFGKVAYFPSLGGIAVLPKYASNILFMPTR